MAADKWGMTCQPPGWFGHPGGFEGPPAVLDMVVRLGPSPIGFRPCFLFAGVARGRSPAYSRYQALPRILKAEPCRQFVPGQSPEQEQGCFL
jgi:hypothetical protein